MQKFVTFGETMVQYNAEYTGEFDPNEQYFLDVAGAESNVAINLSKITKNHVEIFWISRLGEDEAGHLIHNTLSKEIKIDAPIYKGEQTSRGGYKYKSAVSAATVNCDNYSQTEMYLLFYKDSMEEELIEANDPLGIQLPRDYPPTGSVGRKVLEFVCSYKLKNEKETSNEKK